MRRFISVLAIGLLAPVGCALAQTWGVSIGRMYSWISEGAVYQPGTATATWASRMDVNAGLTYRVQLQSRFAFQPELWYLTKGTELRGSSQARIRMTYIELPLTLRWGGAASGRDELRPVVTAGVAPSFLVACIWQPRFNPTHECGQSALVWPSSQPEVFPAPRTLDVSSVIAAGVEWRTSRGAVIALDMRRTMGLRDLDTQYPDFWRHNRSWGFVLDVSRDGRKSAQASR